MKTLKVVTDKPKSLFVMPRLWAASFDIVPKGARNACIVVSVIQSIAAKTRIPPDVIYQQLPPPKSEKGRYTLEELYNFFNYTPVIYRDKKYLIFLDLHEYFANEVIDSMKAGRPLVMIFPSVSNMSKAMRSLESKQTAQLDTLDPFPQETGSVSGEGTFHSYLMFGYDTTGDGFIWCREMRNKYAYNGFFRMPVSVLKFPQYKYFSIEVEKVVALSKNSNRIPSFLK